MWVLLITISQHLLSFCHFYSPPGEREREGERCIHKTEKSKKNNKLAWKCPKLSAQLPSSVVISKQMNVVSALPTQRFLNYKVTKTSRIPIYPLTTSDISKHYLPVKRHSTETKRSLWLPGQWAGGLWSQGKLLYRTAHSPRSGDNKEAEKSGAVLHLHGLPECACSVWS